jgi:hypothetical protein
MPSSGPSSGGSFGRTAAQSPSNQFNTAQYVADSLTPILVDFPPSTASNDVRQAGRIFPSLRSASEKA